MGLKQQLRSEHSQFNDIYTYITPYSSFVPDQWNASTGFSFYVKYFLMRHFLKRMHLFLFCSACMLKALFLLQGFMMYYFLHLLLMSVMLYVIHTLLIIYLVLFRFIVNTSHWHQNFLYSTRHIISKYSAALSLIRSVAGRRPRRLGFEVEPPSDIRYRQV